MNYAKPLLIAVALASLTLTACLGATGEVEEPVGTAQQAALTGNALTGNALTGNALTGNALTGNALTGNALTGNALTGNALTGNALMDPSAREVLQFIVSCALPASELVEYTVDGVAYIDDGQLGLAPEWGETGGHCDGTCKQRVSACVISRLDFLGEHVEISLRGGDPPLPVTGLELFSFTEREATYYGDIFSLPQHIYGCLSPGQSEIPRVCGPTVKGCVVDVLGSCADLCGSPQSDGSFPDCVGPAAPDGVPVMGGDDIYPGSLTVFLQP